MILWHRHKLSYQNKPRSISLEATNPLSYRLASSPLNYSAFSPKQASESNYISLWTSDLIKVWYSSSLLTLSPWSLYLNLFDNITVMRKTARLLESTRPALKEYLAAWSKPKTLVNLTPFCLPFRGLIRSGGRTDMTFSLTYKQFHNNANRRRIKKWLKRKYTSLLWR